MARASSSMIRATAKVFLTGIKGLLRSSTRPPHGKPVNLVILFVAVRIRAGRTLPGEVAIAEALTAVVIAEALIAEAVAGNPPPSGVDVIALLAGAGVSGEVKRGNRAAVAVQAVRAVAAEAVEEEAVAAEAAAEAAEAVVVAAAADGDKNW